MKPGTTLSGVFLALAMVFGTPALAHAGVQGHPPAQSLTVKVTRLSNQIDNLSQQYDALKIQRARAHHEARIARLRAEHDEYRLAVGQSAVNQLAAQSYMAGPVNPVLQLLEGSAPQTAIDRVLVVQHLQKDNGDKVITLIEAENAAERAELAAQQQAEKVNLLTAQIKARVQAIKHRETVLKSRLLAQTMSVFASPAQFSSIHIHGHLRRERALRWALTRRGDPYVWGAAGPRAFDCSGLVLWAYEHVGIHLDHFTGDQWNEGRHIPRSELKAGDLVFFYPDIGHVGMYVGHGLMVDAPTFGQPVQVQAVFWDEYVGAVRISR